MTPLCILCLFYRFLTYLNIIQIAYSKVVTHVTSNGSTWKYHFCVLCSHTYSRHTYSSAVLSLVYNIEWNSRYFLINKFKIKFPEPFNFIKRWSQTTFSFIQLLKSVLHQMGHEYLDKSKELCHRILNKILFFSLPIMWYN